ncbi:AAA family ATPase [Rhizobium tumorigenes]|uniref:AAA family ATPase n=1 Tax=Rhizobium tumorigenes TaxID=2041385 RepID=UPI00241DDFD7|nr:AAA family ATPase [Rhizobium tumorigenes]WFS02377.1 AAA family ATPase [Rhizobium tumorigenes]
MKYLSKKRDGFAMPEFLAYCAVSSAMRRYRRCRYYAVVIVIPEGGDADVYYRAVEAYANPDPKAYKRTRNLPALFNSKSSATSTNDVLDALTRDKAVALYPDVESIATDVVAATDAIIELRPPTIRDVTGIIRWLYEEQLDAEDALMFLSAHPRRLKAVMRPGRPLKKIIAALRQKNTPDPPRKPSDQAVDLRLESMHGYGEAKDWGLNLARDIADWKAGVIGWHDVDKGLLLSGPPGSGKTIFAQALGATCEMHVIYSSSARWQAKGHLGDFLKAMLKSFEEARSNVPCILFIDEIDSFGSRDGKNGDNDGYVRQTINGLLEQLDGSFDREGVVVVAACNHPHVLDPAIVRAGRLDHHIRIPLPDAEARAGILRMHLREDLPAENFIEFSRETEGLSGADLSKIIREARRVARRERRGLIADDIRRVLPKKFVVPADAMRAHAAHEIGHAVVGNAVGMELEHVEIQGWARLAGGREQLGGAWFAERRMERRTKQLYLDRVCTFMAGIAAETLIIGQHDDGAGGGEGSDLHEATNIVIAMEQAFGMGALLANFGSDPEEIGNAKRFNPALMVRVDAVLREQLKRATSIIEENRPAVEWLSEQLLERRELSGEEVRKAVAEMLPGSAG